MAESTTSSSSTAGFKSDWLGREDNLPWIDSEWIGEVVNSPMAHEFEIGEVNNAPTLMQRALDWKNWNLVRIVGYKKSGGQDDVIFFFLNLICNFKTNSS